MGLEVVAESLLLLPPLLLLLKLSLTLVRGALAFWEVLALALEVYLFSCEFMLE